MRPADHARYTGTDNVRILENARYLAHSGARILFRQPIIPTVNDTEKNVLATAAFIRSLGREDLAIELMPYHRMGSSKYAALGLPYELDSLQIMPMEAMERLQKIYENNGVSCAISK